MTAEFWKKVEDLYNQALEQAPEARETFLEKTCAGDAELLREVTELLAHDDSTGQFIEVPAMRVAARLLALQEPSISNLSSSDSSGSGVGAPTPDSLSSGELVRNFRIIRKISQGGMGQVYEAEDTLLHRRVALKVLHVGPGQTNRLRLLREARAASALNHSNIITIYAIEEHSGADFIVMEYVEGETLQAVLERGPMKPSQVIELGLQVASAATAAHTAGIIHRDLKPANILIAPGGQAKVLDFGLARKIRHPSATAKFSDASIEGLSGSEFIIGSAAYMSPEQTRGEVLDERTDIFSLGSVLYEAATGRRPFNGPSTLAVLHAIATEEPPSPSSINPMFSEGFDRMVGRALAKAREDRYPSAESLVTDLMALRSQPFQPPDQTRPRTVSSLLIPILAAVAVIVGLWSYYQSLNRDWARRSLARIEELAQAEKYDEAYELAKEVRGYLPDDPALSHWMPVIADDLSVITDPPGAMVYLKRRSPRSLSGSSLRERAGVTPITHLEIPRAEYIIEIEKEGYAPVRQSMSSSLDRIQRAIMGPPDLPREVRLVQAESGQMRMKFDSLAPLEVSVKLISSADSPDRMVFVPGGEYTLVGHGRPTHETVVLDDFHIDQFEVTNQEYFEFIQAGGYRSPEFWKLPFGQGGSELSWEEAMSQFKDRTGLAGPRGWSSQSFPRGRETHPVTDISWYEAAAYAEFRGKKLPTVFQWEKAARKGSLTHLYWFIMPWGVSLNDELLPERANLLGTDTTTVDSYEYGMSPFGAYQMAGNVSEWLLNRQENGFTTAGGSWKDLPYLFGVFGAFPDFFSADTLGFRCVLGAPGATGDQGGMALNPEGEISIPKPVNSRTVEAMLRHYQYDREPLQPSLLEVRETDLWRREKISFNGAAGKRALAYLYLPRFSTRPLQAIHYVPSDGALAGLSVPVEVETHAAPYFKAGRAVFAVVLEGYQERPWPPGFGNPSMASVKFREMVVNWSVDLQRGLDYLAGREEIDPSRIAALGVSVNNRKLALILQEKRYRSIVLLSAGNLKSYSNMIPETDGVNFAPYIQAPVLMIQGRYDEAIYFRSEALPLFEILPQPKELFVFDQGHIPPLEVSVPVINQWLDRTLGTIPLSR